MSLLAFSVFVFIQDPRIENFWPLIGISLAGLTIIISVVGILGISCSSGHCLNLHIVLATCSLFVYASISVFSGLRFSGTYFSLLFFIKFLDINVYRLLKKNDIFNNFDADDDDVGSGMFDCEPNFTDMQRSETKYGEFDSCLLNGRFFEILGRVVTCKNINQKCGFLC